MEDTRLSKAADLAAKQYVLLASDAPDAWKRPQLSQFYGGGVFATHRSIG